jgi:hypothetical protein
LKVTDGRAERGERSCITELTGDMLEFQDPAGRVERFERVADATK